MRVYDPCVGSGGMLIQSKEYVEEHGGDPRTRHDGAFWRRVERAMPDYKARKMWLAEHGHQY